MTKLPSNAQPLSMFVQAHVLGAFISHFEHVRTTSPDIGLQEFYADFLSQIGKPESTKASVLNTPGQRLGIFFMTIAFAKESFDDSFPKSFEGAGPSEWGVINLKGAATPKDLVRRLRNSIAHGNVEINSNQIVFNDKPPKTKDFDFSATFNDESIFLLLKKIAIQIKNQSK